MVKDTRGRSLRDLRISLTDRCNMRCRYCMPKEHFPNDHKFIAKKEILTYEEISEIVHSLIPLGLKKIRLTGGEPLLRKDICNLIKLLPRDLDIALTTNGLLLEKNVSDLASSGLNRVTVSLDALDKKTFQEMGDTNESPGKVLQGIETAVEAGLLVKVNCVVRKGINEHSVEQITNHFSNTDVVVRFIEYMDVGETNDWSIEDVLTGEKMREMLQPITKLQENYRGEVANRYKKDNQEIGFIESVSRPFCSDCNRARLSADGKLFTCLFANQGHDLKSALRMGASKEQLGNIVTSIWKDRDDAYSEKRGKLQQSKVEMSYIGG